MIIIYIIITCTIYIYNDSLNDNLNDTSGSPMAEALGEAADPRPCIDIHAGQAGYSWWMDEG